MSEPDMQHFQLRMKIGDTPGKDWATMPLAIRPGAREDAVAMILKIAYLGLLQLAEDDTTWNS